MKRKCKYCNTIFVVSQIHKKFCSKSCRDNEKSRKLKLWVRNNYELYLKKAKDAYYKNREKNIERSKSNYRKYKLKKGYLTKKYKYSLNYYHFKDKHKTSARSKLAFAIKSGLLKKPKICEACKKYKRVEGHHRDYSKPLNVIWLCDKCHHLEHRRMRDKTRIQTV